MCDVEVSESCRNTHCMSLICQQMAKGAFQVRGISYWRRSIWSLPAVSSEMSKNSSPAGIFEILAGQHVREENVEEMPLDSS